MFELEVAAFDKAENWVEAQGPFGNVHSPTRFGFGL